MAFLPLTAGITWTAVRTAPCTCRLRQTRAGEGEQRSRVWICTVFSDPTTPVLWFFFYFPSLWSRDAFFSKTGITKVCISSFQLKNCIIWSCLILTKCMKLFSNYSNQFILYSSQSHYWNNCFFELVLWTDCFARKLCQVYVISRFWFFNAEYLGFPELVTFVWD